MQKQNDISCESCALSGLSAAEVSDRRAKGLVNTNTNVRTKSISEIVRSNTLTLFNAINLLLTILVITTGELRNLLFIWVVIANLVIGIFQEVRSKLTVDKLSVLAQQNVCVMREGQEQEVALSDIVLDDVMLLRRGNQVPADACVLQGEALVDESLLTGESESVHKEQGDELLSGSYINSGQVYVRAVRVGSQSYAAQINAQAKKEKPVNSEIMRTLNMIIKFATYLLIPLGFLLFARSFFKGGSYDEAMLSAIAAVAGMIPQGLVLLTSTVLAIATARLAKQMVLVQQLYCIETLARVDVLCLDKTGTITSGDMEVEQAYAYGKYTQEEVDILLASIAHASAHDLNQTAQALLTYSYAHTLSAKPVKTFVPFDSAKKYSGCVLEDGQAIVLGAAQFVFSGDTSVNKNLKKYSKTSRVLVLASVEGFQDGAFVGKPQLIGSVCLHDKIRDNAAQTVSYFTEQGVDLKVISGDDPQTVSAIAQQVGIIGADSWIDATTLTTEEKIDQAAQKYTVFGRVTPQQKRSIVRALQSHKHSVAMTGDGVNDILAFREADCSVAMSSGSDAARNIAELVLVDDDFAHMPQVVAEGRRSINNLQRSASLFLVKTIFSMMLAILCIIRPPYPFIPVQMSLISAALIGLPSFVLALETNHERIQGSFLENVLSRAIPASLMIVLAVGLSIFMPIFIPLSQEEVSTICMILTSCIGIALIVQISLPLNILRKLLIGIVCGILFVGIFVFPQFFEIAHFRFVMLIWIIVMAVVSLALFFQLFRYFTSKTKGKRLLHRFVKYIDNNQA